ncbi:MAG: hypothetical protein ABSH41_21695 [Syntrophobacteraceae bacterium]
MSKKTKKAQTAENHETTNETSEENQMEAANHIGDESTPATIVEASEAEIFATQTEGQEAVINTEGESQVVEGPAVATECETVEQPAPAKKVRVSKRPYISLVEEHLELGNLDKKELLALIMERFPAISKNGVSTFLTDALNPKYSHWKDRVVGKTVDGKMIFADKIEEPAPDVQTAEAQPEQPAE